MIAAKAVLADLRRRFGAQVGIDLRAIDGLLPLWPAEAPAMARAVPARLAEFSTGRACARAAMVALGLPEAAVPMGADRAPVWPVGLVGSISHGAGICGAIVAQRGRLIGLGLDIEPDAPLPPDVAGVVLSAKEAARPASDHRVLFSVKEAVFKAFYPLSGEIWGFDAVSVDLLGDGFAATLAVSVPGWPKGAPIQGHVIRRDGLIVAALALRTPD